MWVALLVILLVVCGWALVRKVREPKMMVERESLPEVEMARLVPCEYRRIFVGDEYYRQRYKSPESTMFLSEFRF